MAIVLMHKFWSNAILYDSKTAPAHEQDDTSFGVVQFYTIPKLC